MEEITISKLKAKLCSELKRVREGTSIVVLDRSTPVAILAPIPESIRVSRKRIQKYEYSELPPLTEKDPLQYLDGERQERW
jgi:prevent-host-death family protein